MSFTQKNVLQTLVNVAVFSYVLAIYWVEALPGLSRLVHLTIGIMFISLVIISWHRGLKIRLEPVMLLFWIFMIFAYLSIYWSGNPFSAALSTTSLFFNILGASLVWIGFWNGVPLRMVGYAAVIGAAIQSNFALTQFFSSQGDSFRAEGLTGNANSLAIQLSLAALLALITLKKSFWPPVIAFAFVLIATVVSGSRKIVFVWFAFSLLFLQYVGTKFRTSNAFRILLLLGVPVFVYVVMSNASLVFQPVQGLYVYERFQDTLAGNESSANVRGAMSLEGFETWQSSPVIGYGINQFRYISSFGKYAHNNYIELLVSFGVIGFGLYYLIMVVLGFRALRGLMIGSPHAPLLGTAVILLLLWDVALVSYSARLIWLFLSVLGYLSENQIEQAKTTARNPARHSVQGILRQ